MELFLTLKLYLRQTELFEMELFLTLKLYLRQTELFEIEKIYTCTGLNWLNWICLTKLNSLK